MSERQAFRRLLVWRAAGLGAQTLLVKTAHHFPPHASRSSDRCSKQVWVSATSRPATQRRQATWSQSQSKKPFPPPSSGRSPEPLPQDGGVRLQAFSSQPSAAFGFAKGPHAWSIKPFMDLLGNEPGSIGGRSVVLLPASALRRDDAERSAVVGLRPCLPLASPRPLRSWVLHRARDHALS